MSDKPPATKFPGFVLLRRTEGHSIEAVNPRYRGATPDSVARALLRPVEQNGKSEAEKETSL